MKRSYTSYINLILVVLAGFLGQAFAHEVTQTELTMSGRIPHGA
jgi:hypothetical protein